MSYGKVNKTTGERIPYAGNSSGGGTSDYTELTHKPSINGVTLSGNKTAADLGMDYETITYTEWQAMTPAQQESGKWDVTGVPGGGSGGTTDYSALTNKPSINSVTLTGNKTASDLSLASTTDIAGKQDKFERISYADWQLLTPQQQAAKPYYIYDYPSSAITAGNVAYDNTSSGMSADDVQEAVDELKSGLTDKADMLSFFNITAATVKDFGTAVHDYVKNNGQAGYSYIIYGAWAGHTYFNGIAYMVNNSFITILINVAPNVLQIFDDGNVVKVFDIDKTEL